MRVQPFPDATGMHKVRNKTVKPVARPMLRVSALHCALPRPEGPCSSTLTPAAGYMGFCASTGAVAVRPFQTSHQPKRHGHQVPHHRQHAEEQILCAPCSSSIPGGGAGDAPYRTALERTSVERGRSRPASYPCVACLTAREPLSRLACAAEEVGVGATESLTRGLCACLWTTADKDQSYAMDKSVKVRRPSRLWGCGCPLTR